MTQSFRSALLQILFAVPVIAVAVGALPALGQAVSTNGGSIQGTVTDASGAAIPNATVIVSSSATGYSHTLQTDKSGFYSLGPLVPGPYNLDISVANFEKLHVSTVIRTGTATPGSEKLTVGNQSETVDVNAGTLQINTDQAGVQGVITREQIDVLPINGRNILDVAQLEPGVILQSGTSFDPTKAGYSAISVSGVGGRTTRILLDGQDITDETVGTTLFNVPSGAVDELQLNRANQDVSGEVTSTGQVLLSTQSGTNAYHGNLFYTFQDNRAGFATVLGANPPFQRNQFGGYMGGPVIKDKLFFFGGAERLKQNEQDVAQSPNPLFNGITQQYPLVPAPFRDTFSTGRLDYSAPHGVHLFARASYSVNADAATFGLIPYSVYQNRDNVPSIVGGADFTTGKFTHSFRAGYEKFHNLLGDETAGLGNSIYNPSTSLANQITLYGSFYAGPNYLAPQQTYQSDKQLRYDGTWTRGAHSVKFGGEMNRIQNGGFAEFYGASLFTYLAASPSLQVANCGGDPTLGPCPNDPVRGYAAQFYQIGNGNSLFSERPGFGLAGGDDPSWRIAAYAADTWKVTPAFTVNAGLRWSVDTDRANQDLPTPLCSQVDPALQFNGCTGNTPLFDQYQPGFGYKTHQPYANFSPQTGFVYSPGNHKTSIRGGIGVFFESDVLNNTGNARPASITTPGAYFNSGILNHAGSSVFLPGFGSVSIVNGVPLSTITTEPISQAAPQINALKAQYQAKVQGSISANPNFIGTGGGLKAANIYAGPYVSPYSLQINGGVQHELARGLIISADYVHNATLKVPMTVDTNHVGAARFLNKNAAQNAIKQTLAACGVSTVDQAIIACPGLHTGANGAVTGATISDFATPKYDANQNFLSGGLDSGVASFNGTAVSANGGTPDTGVAFPGANPNVGQGNFILPIGKSGYDALQVVLQQQRAHPAPGIVSSNLQISYSFSRIVTNQVGVSDQFFGGAGVTAEDSDQPDSYIGRNNLDHTHELSLGGSLGIKYGLQVGMVGHFFSAPPSTLFLDSTAGSTAQIFQTDVTGDGTTGDIVPGTLQGYYQHQVKGGPGLNALIKSYNAQHAGQLTPAGQALVNAGLLTKGQLTSLGGVQQALAPAPNNALQNSAFRNFDLSASYPISLGRFREGLRLVPGVTMYNVFNLSNFNPYQGIAGNETNSTLLNTADAGQPGFLNGPSDQVTLNSNRIERGSGTFDQGGPRTTEFQLHLNF